MQTTGQNLPAKGSFLNRLLVLVLIGWMDNQQRPRFIYCTR